MLDPMSALSLASMLGGSGGGGGAPGMPGGGGGLSLTDQLAFNTGPTDIKTGATFNFSKPASATGVDLSGNLGWGVIAAGLVLALLVFKRSKVA